MAAKVPIRAVFDGTTATGLAEYQTDEFIALAYGGLGASLTIGSAGQVLKVNSAADAVEFGGVEAILNIDGMTDGTSATLAATDKFAFSDGGTEKYLVASQIDTYVSATTSTLTNKTLTTPTITEIDSGSTITLDATTDIVLDADGGDIFFKDGGTTFGSATNTSGNLILKSGTTTAATFSGANVTLAGTLGVGAITGTSTIQGTTITATTAFVPDASDGAALGTSALEFSDLFLADGAVINFGDDQDVTLTHVADTGLLLSSTDQLQFGDSGTYIFQSADGVLDLVSDTEIEINATTIDINGNVEISGDLTVSGDDITMGTNTSGAALIADGTNFNPVVISGDATIATNGALTIAATSVEGSMLNNNVISGQTALTSGVASTDELMISDAGTLKRVDVSLITALATGDATALAIALGQKYGKYI